MKSDFAKFVTIGGVYYDASESSSSSETTSVNSCKSLDESIDTENTSSSWSSSGSANHHEGAPRIARNFSQRLINPNGIQLSDDELMGRIMLKSRTLPKNDGYIASNHVMINNERTRLNIAPLKRAPSLDEVAREHAKKMAQANELFHSDPEKLQEDLVGEESGRRIGENVTKGTNLHAIHAMMMKTSLPDKNNILDRRYKDMGVGTAKAADGTLYLCQIFRD